MGVSGIYTFRTVDGKPTLQRNDILEENIWPIKMTVINPNDPEAIKDLREIENVDYLRLERL